ncbi:HlyD family secretion protein [Rubrivivax sp. JA1024]|nr:HlyD family secretion protein [Rubrivivax sp. JA1024]
MPHGGEVTTEVVIDNKDISFVTAGQATEVKVETLSFTRYGTLPATVTWVTGDAVVDEKRGALFPAMLRLGSSTIDVDEKHVRLSPGMIISAKIKAGRRRAIEYLTPPIQRAVSQSLSERYRRVVASALTQVNGKRTPASDFRAHAAFN